MKRYELKQIAAGGILYIEESDLLAARPRRGDELYPVELELRNREAYRIEDGFHFNAGARTVTIRLSVRQARELVDQDRTEQGKDFCGGDEGHGCFDFGKSADPEDCARCRVLLAIHNAGQGDLRKIRIPLPRREGWGLAAAFFLAVLLFWWTLCRWAEAGQQVAEVRAELAAVRREKQPPAAKVYPAKQRAAARGYPPPARPSR